MLGLSALSRCLWLRCDATAPLGWLQGMINKCILGQFYWGTVWIGMRVMHWRCSVSDSPWCDFLCHTEGSQSVSNGLAEVLLLTAQPELRSRGFPGGCMPSFPGYLSPWKESARGICAKPVSNTEQTPTGKAKEWAWDRALWFFWGFSCCLNCWGCLLLREALSSGEPGVLVTLELATCGMGLLCCKGGGLIYMTKIPVIILLLVWMHVHFFHLVHPAVLIFRADAVCIWSLVREESLILARQTCFMNSCTCELMGAMGWEITEFFLTRLM